MAMRLTVQFPNALDKEGEIRARLAAASLAKCNRMTFNADKTELSLSGEALSVERVEDAFEDQKLPIGQIFSSLNEEENEAADDVVSEEKPSEERMRPIGR